MSSLKIWSLATPPRQQARKSNGQASVILWEVDEKMLNTKIPEARPDVGVYPPAPIYHACNMTREPPYPFQVCSHRKTQGKQKLEHSLGVQIRRRTCKFPEAGFLYSFGSVPIQNSLELWLCASTIRCRPGRKPSFSGKPLASIAVARQLGTPGTVGKTQSAML